MTTITSANGKNIRVGSNVARIINGKTWGVGRVVGIQSEGWVSVQWRWMETSSVIGANLTVTR